MNKIIILLSSLILLSGSMKNSSEENSNQALINAFSATNNDAGIIVSIETNKQKTVYTSGYSDFKKKLRPGKNKLFKIGSGSKIFTAIAILQLVEEGKLSLDTTLDKLYPKGNIRNLANFNGKNYWDTVTVEMLLNHSSGFADYLNAYGSDEKAFEVFNDPNKIYSFADIIHLALNSGDASFIGGEGFAYSNTNYIILGDIISKKSNLAWRQYIEKNIFKKAALKNTFFASTMSKKNKKRLLTGHYHQQVISMPPSLASSAGEIVSNVYDLQKFLSYWASGKFYKNKTTFAQQLSRGLINMLPETDEYKYALGVMELKSTNTIGHGGQTFGFQAYLAINRATNSHYVISINNGAVASLDLLTKLIVNE